MGRLIFCPSFKNREKPWTWNVAKPVVSILHLFIFECKYLPIYLSIIKHTPIESLTCLIKIISFFVTHNWNFLAFVLDYCILICKNLFSYSLIQVTPPMFDEMNSAKNSISEASHWLKLILLHNERGTEKLFRIFCLSKSFTEGLLKLLI